MDEIAEEIRRGAREAYVAMDAPGKLPHAYKHMLKKHSIPHIRHEMKKKFPNIEEAEEWARENCEQEQRAYQCNKCPWVHLTTQLEWPPKKKAPNTIGLPSYNRYKR